MFLSLIALMSFTSAFPAVEPCDLSQMMFFCEEGELENVVRCVEQGIDVNQSFEESTPLITACYNQHLPLVQYLINKGADVNTTDGYGDSALMVAAARGNLDLVVLLKDAEIDKGNDLNETPLFLAAQEGHLKVVEYLIEKGANLSSRNMVGDTPLLASAYKGQLPVVKCLLENGVSIEETNQYNMTSLMEAASGGHVEIVEFLLENNANINAVDDENRTAVIWAIYKNQVQLAEFLLEKGAEFELDVVRLSDLLLKAAANGYLDACKFLFQKGALIDNNGSETPLISATFDNEFQVAQFLLENGANVNLKDSYNKTALTLAAKRGHADLVELYLRYGADINQVMEDEFTPLMLAAYNDHRQVVQVLLDNGARKDLKDASGKTAYDYCLENGYEDLAQLLNATHKYSFDPFNVDLDELNYTQKQELLLEAVSEGYPNPDLAAKLKPTVEFQLFYNATECPICIQTFNKDVQISVLGCKHSFHTSCIDQSISMNRPNSKECPVCSKRVWTWLKLFLQ